MVNKLQLKGRGLLSTEPGGFDYGSTVDVEGCMVPWLHEERRELLLVKSESCEWRRVWIVDSDLVA